MAIRQEMMAVAGFFGESVLRKVRPDQLYANLRSLRDGVGDRSVLRAMHFFNENARVSKALAALKDNDVARFLEQIRASGHSSWELLQNMYASPKDQGLSLALALAQEFLQGEGACRLHGGGFAGTTLNFVPLAKVEHFVKNMGAVFGSKCCMVLDVRQEGACKVF
jgi:galactokinase